MPLLKFWKHDGPSVLSMNIEQIVASAGDGKLKDESECSRELREFLGEAPTSALRQFADYCLSTPFQKSGQVLQDVVNELGRRLDFDVSNGRYQGTTNAIGSDGLWRDPDGHGIVVEVKTTDAYRISLGVIAGYRDRHAVSGALGTPNSMLIVVGREDTGELEAQVRGSHYAWDMRLISVDALLRLVDLKESTEEEVTALKIRGLLRPCEFTRLDELIDVLFTAAKDVEEAAPEPAPGSDTSGNSGWEFTAPALLSAKRDAIVSAVSRILSRTLIRKTRATYWDSDKTVRAVCTISKRYNREQSAAYWYAYHPAWDDFLSAGQKGVFVLGAMDIDICFVIPHEVLKVHLAELNTTEKSDGTVYWHVKVLEPSAGAYFLQMAKTGTHLALVQYQVSVGAIRRGEK